MFNVIRKNLKTAMVFTSVLIVLGVILSGCAQEPEWKATNDQLVESNNIAIRELPYDTETGIKTNIGDGQVRNMQALPSTELAPGVTAKIFWGRGNLVSFVTMDPNAEIPKETLESERIMIMLGGSLKQLVNGEMQDMIFEEPEPMFYFSTGYVGYRHCLYLEEGAENAVKAGPNGAKFVEFYAPVRADYVTKTGASMPSNVKPAAMKGTPNFPPNKIFNYYDVQFTKLMDKVWTRLINGKGVQVSGITMWPNSTFGLHNHPEEQLMTATRGMIEELVLDGTQDMFYDPDTGEQSILFLPAQMVHGGNLSDRGCDAFDVFYPVRDDGDNSYYDLMIQRREAYHSIIPEGEEVKLVAEGFKFTEGPTWMDGELYFSSMFFDIPAGTWKSDASKSDLIALKPDGTFRHVLQGRMQTNGLMADGKGNIIACDMAGHRLIKVSPKGRVLEVLATKITDGDIQKGLRLDGPNDLVIDAKGGIYFTDPQFIFDEKARPSKTVNYRSPDGKVTCVYENPGNKEMQMTNGVLLSPDGKTLYVCSTYHLQQEGMNSEAANHVIAFDVNEDGTLSNKRNFCELLVPSMEFNVQSLTTCADGMTIDAQGNLYVATNMGVQIFTPEGEYIGNIHTPVFPVSVCFGGDNYDTLYMTCWDKVYSVKTKVKGLVYPLK